MHEPDGYDVATDGVADGTLDLKEVEVTGTLYTLDAIEGVTYEEATYEGVLEGAADEELDTT